MSEALCYSGALTKRKALGSPHYSYRFAEEKFLACFAAMDIATHFLPMPEYYGSPRAYATLPSFRGRHVHVIFRSTEQIRILKPAYNILCFAWEFPHLKDVTLEDEHPFANQKRMLALCDEIWVPCRFTKEVLERHGLSNVHCIPAAIEPGTIAKFDKTAAIRRIGHVDCKSLEINFLGLHGRRGDSYTPLFHALSEVDHAVGRQTYLSIFNPEDFRKNFDAMVRGFDAFQQRNPGARLIIKALTSADRFTLDRVVLDVMASKLSSGSSFFNANIVVINHFLDDMEMAALYDLADFYLCTSIAEGQNLPLLEAMARGVVPVTTCNTAMTDYIDINNAVIVETSKVRNENPHLAGNVAGKPYDVELCDARQVRSALDNSAALSSSSYDAMSRAAKATVARTFSIAAIRPQIEARLVGKTAPRAWQAEAPAPGGHVLNESHLVARARAFLPRRSGRDGAARG